MSAGIWIPRVGAHVDVAFTSSELESAQCTLKDDGAELLAVTTGMPGSSYRAELLGIIVATMRPTAIHIALDNRAVQLKAQALVDRLLSLSSAPLPQSEPLFSLQKDGDLWKVLYHLLQMRGPDTVKYSW
eukprot:1955902-Karenia_brevis.AAC.1